MQPDVHDRDREIASTPAHTIDEDTLPERVKDLLQAHVRPVATAQTIPKILVAGQVVGAVTDSQHTAAVARKTPRSQMSAKSGHVGKPDTLLYRT